MVVALNMLPKNFDQNLTIKVWEMQNVSDILYMPFLCAHLVEGLWFSGGSQNLSTWKITQLKWRLFKVKRLKLEKSIWAELVWNIKYFLVIVTSMIYTSFDAELNGLSENKYFGGLVPSKKISHMKKRCLDHRKRFIASRLQKKKIFILFSCTNFKYEQILFFSFFSFALVLAQYQF